MADTFIVNWVTEDGNARCDTFVDLQSMPRDCYGRAIPLPSSWHLCIDARHAVDLFKSRVKWYTIEEHSDPRVTP